MVAWQAALEAARSVDRRLPKSGRLAKSKAVVGRFYRPIKKSLTIRVDADVLAWLKSDGKGYQTRINNLLRNAMDGPGSTTLKSLTHTRSRAKMQSEAREKTKSSRSCQSHEQF